MDTLFTTLTNYIELLVLGAVAIPVLCAPFGLREPLTAGWDFLNRLVARSHSVVQVGLLSGATFSILLFLGFFLNSIGSAFLFNAHMSTINSVKEYSENHKIPSYPRFYDQFYWKMTPLFGPYLRDSSYEDEISAYWDDGVREVYWGVCDKDSFDSLTYGTGWKQLKLLRGVVGLVQVFIPVSVIGSFLGLVKISRSDKPRDARCICDINSTGLAYIKWSFSGFIVVVLIYLVWIVPAYWNSEFYEHDTVWEAFPYKPDVKDLDNVLPCKKMTKALQQKNEAAEKGPNASSGTTPAP